MVWALLVIVLALLHRHTLGRSSPFAALAFIVAGPVLGVVVVVARAFNPSRADLGRFYGLTPAELAMACVTAGLAAAVCVGCVHAALIADELRAYRREPGGYAPRPVASAALQALGLNAFATAEDVERAYRERVKLVHPDHGGDVTQFKRLQRDYERAKKQVRRSASNGARQPARP